MKQKPSITVVGSLIMDLVFRADRRPNPGETFAGDDFGMFLGGKGFNQAVACHRLGAHVTLVGRVGDDLFGEMFVAKLADEGMSTDLIARDPQCGTGVASPVVFPDGENSIIGVPRANRHVTTGDIDRARETIEDADTLMLQLEVNPDASRYAAVIARESSTKILLDPAPAHLHSNMDDWPVDYLVPNEVEAKMLLDNSAAKSASWEDYARQRVTSGLRAAIVTEGRHGATIVDASGRRSIPAYSVRVVDSTGAGDAFRSGLAVRLAQGVGIDQAVRYASACGALACTRMGAEPSMPTSSEVEDLQRSENEHPD